MDLGDLNKVWEIKALRKIGEEDARNTLERIAKQVQPIMHKRRWKVKRLSEFSPQNPSLLGLNINGGAEIKLRLRVAKSDWNFIPYEQVLDTMLHELCHIEHGPHNSHFYGLLDDIRKECEDLMAKGITGTGKGFDLTGRRLGGFKRQPSSSLRSVAFEAAEKRARKSAMMPSGCNRVGGDGSIKDFLTPTQAAAMAAERRLHDDLWCASHSSDTDKLIENSAAASPPANQAESSSSDPGWKCGVCTLLNKPMALACDACWTTRRSESNLKEWACKFCTLQNTANLERCLACGEWRYSYGPPAATYGPNVGT